MMKALLPLHLLTPEERHGALIALAHVQHHGLQLKKNAAAMSGRNAIAAERTKMQRAGRAVTQAADSIQGQITGL